MTVNLPKWPGMVVVGQPVTPDQAAEILIRTDRFDFHCNDRDWNGQLIKAVGLDFSQKFPHYDYNEMDDVRNFLRVLNLQYLHNDCIASSYAFGPHGWCDWRGQIGCNSYNIGKWPSVEEVQADWQLIAEAFPYLDLTCQLFSGEYCEDGIRPLVAFRVKDGTVNFTDVDDKLGFATVTNDAIIKAFSMPTSVRERGCTIEQFKHGLALCRKAS
jgi:hypothetical protein